VNNEQIEKELRDLRPAATSVRLEQSIAQRLDRPTSRNRGRRMFAWAAAAGLTAAASLMLAVWLDRTSGPRVGRPVDQPQVEQSQVVRLTPEQIKALPPTEWGYLMAYQSSPEDLDLYREHLASTLLPRGPEDGD
jgi:hypothetical protein